MIHLIWDFQDEKGFHRCHFFVLFFLGGVRLEDCVSHPWNLLKVQLDFPFGLIKFLFLLHW